MDEVDEEIRESLESYILKEKLDEMILEIQDATKGEIIDIINTNYADEMSSVRKLILGEKIARIVTGIAKDKLRDLSSTIFKRSFDLVDELRNEIIGEVFEETEVDK